MTVPAPAVKNVMTKSSIDSVNAISAPAMTPGMMSGSVTWKKARSGVAPQSRAASTSDLVHAGQAGAHDDRDEADAEGDVGERDRQEAEREIEHHEEDEQRHPHQDLGNRDRREHQDRQQAQPVAVHGEARERAQDRSTRALATSAISSELPAASSISLFCASLRYQSSVKPTHSALRRESLNEYTTTITSGR